MTQEVASSSLAQAKKLYLIGRRDLKPGLRAAQMAHVLTEFLLNRPAEAGQWYAKSNNLVLLEAENEEALKELLGNLIENQVGVSTFREPDLKDELTAVCVGDKGRQLLSSLPLALK